MPRALPPLLVPLSPRVPPLFRTPSNKRHRRNRPRRSQLAFLGTAATEVRESKEYRADFGNYVPDPKQLADALDAANRWSTELRAAQLWLAYVEDEDARAWTRVLQFLRAFAPAFLIAAKHTAVARRYGAVAQIINARRKPRKNKTAKKARAQRPPA